MSITLASRPKQIRKGVVTALQGMSHPELVALSQRMAAEEPRFIFDTLRPVCDEFWNLIDGRRTVGDIAEALCMQFDLELDPNLFIPLAEGLAKIELITVE